MTRILLLASLLFVSFLSFSQQAKIDSLKNVIKSTSVDTVKLTAYYNLVSLYSNSNIELAENYLDSFFSQAESKKLHKYILTGYSQKGVLAFRKADPEKAIQIWNEGLAHPQIDNFPIQKGNLFHNISVAYKATKNTDSVISFIHKSISLNIRETNSIGLIANYFSLSDYYSSIEVNDSAVTYLNKLMDLAIIENDSIAVARAYILLANISKRELDYKDSIKQFEKALSIYIAKEPNNLIMRRGLLFEISRSMIHSKNYMEAIPILESIEAQFKTKLFDEVFWNDLNVSLLNCYIETSDFENATAVYKKLILFEDKNTDDLWLLNWLSKYEIWTNRISEKTYKRLLVAEKMADKTHEIGSIQTIKATLSSYFYKKQNFSKAYLLLKESYDLNHEIRNEETSIINLAQKRKFNEVLKEKENLTLKQQNAQQALLTEKEKTQKWAMGGGLAVSLAGLGIFFLVYRRNQKQKKEIEKQKNLVENLQRELHHRLKNNLSFIDFFITLAKGKFPDPAYREKLDELQNRISSMFEVHKQLFKKEDVTSVNAKTYISALIANVKKAYERPNIVLEEKVESVHLRSDTSFPIGLIVNEFFTNSYKYAFPNNEKGVISISLNEDRENYHLKLEDNGKGLPENFDIDTLDSFGMETIKLLTVEYKGTFKLDGSNGLKMDITFPKNAA